MFRFYTRKRRTAPALDFLPRIANRRYVSIMNFARIRTLYRAVLLLCLPGLAGAHVGDRVYPIAYLTDEMVEHIRVDDGSVDEWHELVGEPSLTILDCSDKQWNEPFDPSDLDFRIWLAWHDDPARFYVAFVGSDDAYENDHDYSVDSFFRDLIHTHDSIRFSVDADHAGGPGFRVNTDPTVEERHEFLGRAQNYAAIARTASGSTLDQRHVREQAGTAWTALPPYGKGGGSVFGEAPFISVIEAYVTPYDSWVGWEGEQVEVSRMAPGQVIGFGFIVYDYDPGDEWRTEWTPGIMPSHLAPDRLVDGLLLGPDSSVPPGDDSAVESLSWARIKASLEVE